MSGRATYSSRDVASIVGISESRVRYWAQTGVVGPSERAGGRAVYNFQDLVSVKAAKELLDGGLTLQRARKNLDALRAQLGDNRPLANVRVRSDGERVIVCDGAATYEPLSGQLLLDFAVDDLQGQVAELSVSTAPPESMLPTTRAESAWAWFLEGGTLEAGGDDERALIAYHKALDGDPALAAAHTNVGNLHYRRGERGEARAAYETALALDPEQPEARYNLGNLLADVGEHDAARVEWYRVAGACPEFADAHYNLALACARDGDDETARLHLYRYLALVPDDTTAQALLDGFDRRPGRAHNTGMPIYEYACECGASFESLERVGEVRQRCGAECAKRDGKPAHGEGHVERRMSTGMIRGDGREAKEVVIDPCKRSNRPGGGCGGDEY